MYDYETFKKLAEERFRMFLPEEYRNAAIETRLINRVNKTLEAFCIIDDQPGLIASPVIYVEDMYADYLRTEDMEMALTKAAETYMKGLELRSGINLFEIMNAEKAKESVIYQLVNTEQNKAMLADMPHRRFNDLSIIYRLVLKADGNGLYTFPIHNRFASGIGMTEEQLFDLAEKNTRKLQPVVIKSMGELLMESTDLSDMPADIAAILTEEKPPKEQQYVISNTRQAFGACGMLYEDELHKLAEKMGTDLYILPSSIHEVIAVSTEMDTAEELAEMVMSVNQEQVDIRERLSNQVYHYDKERREVTLATDTPYKRIDGIVAEAPVAYKVGKSR
jgi:hypothetical protein